MVDGHAKIVSEKYLLFASAQFPYSGGALPATASDGGGPGQPRRGPNPAMISHRTPAQLLPPPCGRAAWHAAEGRLARRRGPVAVPVRTGRLLRGEDRSLAAPLKISPGRSAPCGPAQVAARRTLACPRLARPAPHVPVTPKLLLRPVTPTAGTGARRGPASGCGSASTRQPGICSGQDVRQQQGLRTQARPRHQDRANDGDLPSCMLVRRQPPAPQ